MLRIPESHRERQFEGCSEEDPRKHQAEWSACGFLIVQQREGRIGAASCFFLKAGNAFWRRESADRNDLRSEVLEGILGCSQCRDKADFQRVVHVLCSNPSVDQSALLVSIVPCAIGSSKRGGSIHLGPKDSKCAAIPKIKATKLRRVSHISPALSCSGSLAMSSYRTFPSQQVPKTIDHGCPSPSLYPTTTSYP